MHGNRGDRGVKKQFGIWNWVFGVGLIMVVWGLNGGLLKV